MKYKVGDRVRIKTGLKSQTRSGVRLNPKMRKWEGKVMTIESVSDDLYRMLEDIGEPWTGLDWAWGEDWIDCHVTTSTAIIQPRTSLTHIWVSLSP